jgi:hypothetical protein
MRQKKFFKHTPLADLFIFRKQPPRGTAGQLEGFFKDIPFADPPYGGV